MEMITILAVTKTMAAIYLAVCLLGAAVIGYLTSYFYYKPIYLKKIGELEKQLEDRKNEISGLNEKISGLEQKLTKKEEECRELQEKIRESKVS